MEPGRLAKAADPAPQARVAPEPCAILLPLAVAVCLSVCSLGGSSCCLLPSEQLLVSLTALFAVASSPKSPCTKRPHLLPLRGAESPLAGHFPSYTSGGP